MEKLTKTTIKIFILYVTVSLMFGCVTKKKLKESQDLQTTYLLDQNETKWSNSAQNLKSTITAELTKNFNETIKLFKESSSINENETTSIIGTLPTSDKETSVTVGNTVIKNNGGNVSFDIKSSKQLTSQLETINKELTQNLNEERNARISLENTFNNYVKEQLTINEQLKVQLDKQSKETNKKGLSFWVVIILIIGVVVFIAIKFFRNRMPFLN